MMGSAISNTVRIQVAASLPAPVLDGNTSTDAAGMNIALSWDAVTGATEYQLYRSVDGGDWALYQTLSKLEYVDLVSTGPIDTGSVYSYYVTAASNSASSGPSNPFTVVIDAGI